MPTAAQLQSPSVSQQVAHGIVETGWSAVSGALAGYMFTLAPPLGGAMFGATFTASVMLGCHLYDRVDSDSFLDKCVSKIEEHFPNTGMDSKVIRLILAVVVLAIPLFTVSTSLSYLAINAAGFSMTLGGAFKMAIAYFTIEAARESGIALCCGTTEPAEAPLLQQHNERKEQ